MEIKFEGQDLFGNSLIVSEDKFGKPRVTATNGAATVEFHADGFINQICEALGNYAISNTDGSGDDNPVPA